MKKRAPLQWHYILSIGVSLLSAFMQLRAVLDLKSGNYDDCMASFIASYLLMLVVVIYLYLSSDHFSQKSFRNNQEKITYSRIAFSLASDYESVFYLDSDDSISIDMFEVCLGVITTTNADVAVPNLIQRKPDGTVRDNFLECQIVTNSVISGQEAFERSIDWRGVWSYLMCKAYLYKKYACDERYLYGGFNSDELITRMILLNAKMVAYCPSEYYYNVNLESITKKITHKIFGYLETHIRLIQAAEEFGQPRNVMAKIETNAFREMIELWHKYRENRDLFSKEERRDVESQFASFYDRFPKGNVKALLAPRPGLTPKLQSLLMLNGWPLCKASLTLAAKLGKKNKLYPWFSEEQIKSMK